MPWLLSFIQQIISELPDDLNASVVKDNEDFEVAIIELDEQWSYVGNKKNQQWLWLAFHSATRQVLAMHVGKRDKRSAEALLSKLPEDLKKKPSFIRISSQSTTKSFLSTSTMQLKSSQVRRATLSDLTIPCDNDVLD